MWITPAYAQASPTNPLDGLLSPSSPIWMMAIIFVIMYVLMIRPQQKRVKQHQEMVKNLRRGDSVITSGGTVGKVTKVVDDEQIEIEIAQGVRVRQMRSMASSGAKQ
jgi:preprotein translocase subunit YajC